MKRFFLLLFAAAIGLGLQAQEGAKAFKKAKSLLNSYNLDDSKVDDLAEAGGLLETMLGDSEIGGTFKTLKLAAQVYAAMSVADQKGMIAGTIDKPRFAESTLQAYDHWVKAHGAAEKKFEVKEGLAGIAESARYLNNLGFNKYEAGNAEGALKLFEKTLAADKLLKDNSMDGVLATDSAYHNQLFITSAMATSAGQLDKAEGYLQQLIEVGYQDPLVYSNLYKIYEEKDPEKAVSYLEQGRKAFPNDVNMLFTEINYYLKQGRLEELTGKLQKAIEAEPNNASVRSTLGNVYDQLYQKEHEAGNGDKSMEYFGQAEKYYNEALSIDQGALETNYSLGALYYNKAVIHVKEMNELADDYSKEGTRKYEAKKAEAMVEFDRSLPYFEKAYSINPKDRNTLIALREIYVRKDMFDKSNEMKEQLEAIGG